MKRENGRAPRRREGAGIPGKASTFYRLAWAFYLLLAVAGALWLGAQRGTIGPEVFVDASRWWLDLAGGVGGGVGLLAVWEVARRRLPAARQLESELRRLLGTVDRPEVVGLALLSGFSEELFFRGAVQQAWGWLPATLLFALVHTGPGRAFRVWTGFAAVAGAALAGLTLWSGSLLAAMVAHALVNGVNLARLGGPRTSPGERPAAAEGLVDSAGSKPKDPEE